MNSPVMLDIFKDIKAKADKLKLEFEPRDEYGDTDYDSHDFKDMWLLGEKNEYTKTFRNWLVKNYNYKHIIDSSDHMPDYNDWPQGNDLPGFTVIQLNDKCYKITYEVSSYGGINCSDYWNWVEAVKVDKKVTFYLPD